MNTVEKIEAVKKEYEKKYKVDRMEEILQNGYFEKETRIAKSDVTETAKKQCEIMADIYNKYMELIHEKGYDIGYNEYSREFEIQQKETEYEDNHMSYHTSDFLDNFHNPYEDLISYHNIILAAYTRYDSSYKGLQKGDRGEAYVNRELELFRDKYKFASNIKIANIDFKGKTSETDLYVITSKGILVCEIKNKGNEKCRFKISKDGQWRKETGKHSEVMDSPFAQNTRHCIATERLLRDNGINDYKIIPVVIIANEKVQIENNSENAVIRISELYNYVQNLQFPEKYTEEYQNKILAILKQNNITDDNYFPSFVVEKDMLQKTITYANYLLDMIEDTRQLLQEIGNLEKQLFREEQQKAWKTIKRKQTIRWIAEAVFAVTAVWLQIFILWAVVVIYGIRIWYCHLLNEDEFQEQKGVLNMKIITKGEY